MKGHKSIKKGWNYEFFVKNIQMVWKVNSTSSRLDIRKPW
jgi:hypothetical protein